ncbi:MAG: recombination mediator RecR [Eubacteriales bacterium]|nr:recombination mediator RecR [Eubacteriales bacterium]MCI7570087.1 recombination mediator RecR [Clostridiales bacterium]MDD7550957.1 recombination mediator RecR [Clostridia bacterium]MDY5754386.1 recombination mediator RecR [Eubacteriales bacterium]
MGIEPIQTLASRLARLPGIGNKSALRLAYHILDMSEDGAKELADAIINARSKVQACKICGAYTDVDPCAICSDKSRRKDIICVVAEAKDVLAMEKMREYHGQYHVLGGVLSPMNGIGPSELRIDELLKRIKEQGVSEVIIATNPDVEGEATSSYIARIIKQNGVRVTRIAHGIPIGGNLEYIDEMTLFKAIEGRREI